MRVLRCVVLCVLSACASSAPRGPFFDDEKYLRFGVDPNAEANAVIKDHEDRGHALALRVVGQSFTALSFIDTHGKPSAVRIITAAGIKLALDSTRASALVHEEHYELVPPPIADTQDADGDGFEEVFIRMHGATQTCLLLYRVGDVGFVDQIPITLTLFGEPRCPSDLEDVDRDRRTELIVDVKLGGFGTRDLPHVRVGLWAKDHRFARDANPAARAQLSASERGQRSIELTEARRMLDVDWAFRLAVELAALALVDDASADEQVRVFDAALTGLVLDASQAAAIAAARVRIHERWNEALGSQETP